jgi:threonine aldolase
MQALVDAVRPDDRPGRYGNGALLRELEADIAGRLGKPAALFMPTGTMAQQIALRIWCERAGVHRVAFHPTCHLHLYEDEASVRLHGLETVLCGEAHRLIEPRDIAALPRDLGAVLLELPQREIGAQLPEWETLQTLVTQLRSRGLALHLDGARIWESAIAYGRTPAELAELFDSVYVSFYKGLGALAGAGLAGSEDFITEARRWRHRHGGVLFTPLPLVLSVREAFGGYPERIARYLERAREVGRVLAALDGVHIGPDPPHVNQFQVHMAHPIEAIQRGAAAVAKAHGVNLVGRLQPTSACTCWFELYVAESAEEIDDVELERLFSELLEYARAESSSALPETEPRTDAGDDSPKVL